MRKKTVSQASLFDQAVHQLISLIKPEKALMDMNKVLDENPDIFPFESFISNRFASPRPVSSSTHSNKIL